MLTVAYLANQFPSLVEPYVADEIAELRSRGVRVVAASVLKDTELTECRRADIVVLPISISLASRAIWLCVSRCMSLLPLLRRIGFRGREGPWRRLKAVVHTFLGACFALRLRNLGVKHVHVHHGYFGSWVGMTAAKLIGAGFSFTLHGSDLLLHSAYLDTKLAASDFCVTVSEYNRRFIVERYPWAEHKVLVSRLGVDGSVCECKTEESGRDSLRMFCVGRLHAVKDHAFLIRACARLMRLGIRFRCSIAGEGPERRALELLIRRLGLTERVTLLGRIEHERLAPLYDDADLVVLTSRSEGIPLVLMEAMSRGKIVLAPAITGIPELVIPGATGFLYQPGSMQDFVNQLLLIRSMMSTQVPDHGSESCSALLRIRHAARVHVLENFDRTKNLRNFADLFLNRVATKEQSVPDENLILQQI